VSNRGGHVGRGRPGLPAALCACACRDEPNGGAAHGEEREHR
jgi:hypothetical protein